MDQQLKTRLIGVTIVVSLVVIFVPMLFEDSSDNESVNVNTASIPEFPQEFQSQSLALPPATQGMTSVPSPAKADIEPLPEAAPVRDEPLDPLDVPVADEGEGREVSPDAQDALLPEKPHSKPSIIPPTAKPATAVPPKVAPAVKEAPVKTAEKPKSAPVTESAAKAAPSAAAAKPKAAAAKPPAPETKPAAAAPGAPVKMTAWVIQAGVFGDEANAKSLLVKLRQANITAYVEMIPGPSGNSYRVRIGPELDRARVEATLKKMESAAGVKGMIVPYP